MVEPDDEFELLMLDPELLVPDDVEGVVIVLASVERPVLGGVAIVPEVAPVFEPVEPVGAAEPGLIVPVDDGVVAVGLVDDGLVLAPLGEVWACAMPTAPIRAAMEATVVRVFESLIIG
ncbi:MAG: hypothetical protein ABIO45_18330 [Burkholderiaceae bacterium]